MQWGTVLHIPADLAQAEDQGCKVTDGLPCASCHCHWLPSGWVSETSVFWCTATIIAASEHFLSCPCFAALVPRARSGTGVNKGKVKGPSCLPGATELEGSRFNLLDGRWTLPSAETSKVWEVELTNRKEKVHWIIRCQTSDTPDKILFGGLRPKEIFLDMKYLSHLKK